MTKNKTIDLVFGGAGPQRFPVYIGVLRAMADKGYIPYRLDYDNQTSRLPRACGTSAGALILGLYYSGMDIDDIEETIYKVNPVDLANITGYKVASLCVRSFAGYFVKKFTGKNPEWSRPYLNNNKKIYNLLLELTKGKTFSECPGLYIMATDTKTNKEFVFCNYRTPDVSVALGILASISLPIVFPGVLFPNELVESSHRNYGPLYKHVLMDGGIKNNFPVDYLKPVGNIPIVGVKVSDVEKTLSEDFNVLQLTKYSISGLITSREKKSIEDAHYYGIIEINTGGDQDTESNMSFTANEKSKKKWVDIGYEMTYSNIDEAVEESKLQLSSLL